MWNLIEKKQVQNLPFVPEFEELLRFPSIFAFLASKQQIGVKRNNFSAARPWISGCLMVGLWLGKNAVWGIRCLKISQSITSSQFKPIKVSKKDKDTADSYKKKNALILWFGIFILKFAETQYSFYQNNANYSQMRPMRQSVFLLSPLKLSLLSKKVFNHKNK